MPAVRESPALLKSSEPPPPDGLLEGFCPEPGQEEQIALNAGGRLLFLRLTDVGWLEAAANRTALHVGKETYWVDDRFAVLAAKLPVGDFLRISPTVLVRVGQIRGLRRTTQGGWRLLLHNGTRLTLSSGGRSPIWPMPGRMVQCEGCSPPVSRAC